MLCASLAQAIALRSGDGLFGDGKRQQHGEQGGGEALRVTHCGLLEELGGGINVAVTVASKMFPKCKRQARYSLSLLQCPAPVTVGKRVSAVAQSEDLFAELNALSDFCSTYWPFVPGLP